LAERVKGLVAKDLPMSDPEMQVLEDAACLTFLSHGLDDFGKGKDDAKMVDIFAKTWKKMSRAGHRWALEVEYSPRMLGLIVQGIAQAEVSEGQAREVPWLGEETGKIVREAYDRLQRETLGFGALFLQRLDAKCRKVMDWPVCRAQNISKVVDELISLHSRGSDDGAVPSRFEGVIRAAAALGSRFGGLTMDDMHSIKDSAVRVVAEHVLEAARPWEAFVYAVAAVMAPPLMVHSPVADFCSAVARPLPTPGGGPAAAVSASVGIALLEMSAEISARKKGWTAPCEHFMDLRNQAMEQARSDAHAYCGLLSSVYEHVYARPIGKQERWTRYAAEAPVRVIELCFEAVRYAKSIDRQLLLKSVRGDWEAGVQHLRAAVAISKHNVSLNLQGAAGAWASELTHRSSCSSVLEQQLAELVQW